jgi:hypothetical protein
MEKPGKRRASHLFCCNTIKQLSGFRRRPEAHRRVRRDAVHRAAFFRPVCDLRRLPARLAHAIRLARRVRVRQYCPQASERHRRD